MQKKIIVFLFVITLLNIVSYKQNTAVAQSNDKLKKANQLYEKFAYTKAALLYKDILNTQPALTEAKTKLADCYRLTKQTALAEPLYKELSTTGNNDPIYTYYYANMLKANGKYDQAIGILQQYQQQAPNDDRTQLQIDACRKVKDLTTDKGEYVISNASINSQYAEFAPAFYSKGIVFSSENVPEKNKLYNRTNAPFLNLFYAEQIGNNAATLANIKPLGNTKLNKNLHEGAATFAPDQKTLYFTANNYSGKNDLPLINLQIFEAQAPNFEPIPFPYNSDSYSVGHPTLSTDGNTMYFASDMPGGVGGTDIYVTFKENGSWGQPINLGENINTEGNEMFPFISANNVLYYASDGLGGLGGLDVFKVEALGNQWTMPANLGYPINTNADDFAFIINDATAIGYFSSNRSGGKGSDDIYSFVKKANTKPYIACEVRGKIFDKSNSQPVANAQVRLINVKKGEEKIYTTKTDGTYFFKVDPESDYILYATKDYYLTEVKNLSTKGRNCAEPIQQDIILDIGISRIPGVDVNTGMLSQPIKIVDDGSKAVADLDLPTINKIYYDFDKADIRPDAALELDKIVGFMRANPNLKIQLLSHTDSRGTAEYNQQLSERRALAAVQYIVNKGISQSNITAVGKGETEIINRCKDGVQCSDTEHQQNRRTEFVITGFLR